MNDDWGNDPVQQPAQAGADWGNDPVVGAAKFKFSDDALRTAAKKPSTNTVWMKPDEYLALTPELQSNPKTDKKGASLKASLDKGDDVDELPSLDVTVGKGGSAKVVDQDGRHRAQFAKDNGVDMIPVAVTRSGDKSDIKSVVGMRDVTAPMPWNFKPVAAPSAPEVKTSPRWDLLGDIGRAAKGSAEALGSDLGKAFPGAAEQEAQRTANNQKYGTVIGTAKSAIVDPVYGFGNALKAPIDALGIPGSLLMGTLHAGAGSALSYLPGMDTKQPSTGEILSDLRAGGTGRLPSQKQDPKAAADTLVDELFAGLGPEGMAGGAAGITAAAAPANALKTAAGSAKAAATEANLKPGALQAREAGYVLPPTMAVEKPGVVNSLASGVGGKIKLQQGASVRNQEVTNRLAAQDLGLPADTDLTEQKFKDVRAGAVKAYKAVANSVPEITVDPTYQSNIASLGGRNSAANSQFPGVMKNDELDTFIKNVGSVQKFSPDAGLEVVRKLRSDAKGNLKALGDPNKTALGLAQRKAADEIDDLIERNLVAAGKSDLVPEYRDARQLLAKSHDIEGATNTATGDVSARALGRLAARGKPLSGNSKIIADTANAFPKAMQNTAVFGSDEPYSALDAGATAFAAAHGDYGAVATILGRPVVRNALLSERYQNRMIPRPMSPPPSPGVALLNNTPLPGIQNQLAHGIFRAAQVNGLRALTPAQAMAAPPQQGQ